MKSKKRIGIVTITNSGYNFGNRLQNYALQTIIKRMGFAVETINSARVRQDQLNWRLYKKAFLHYIIRFRTTTKHIKSVNFYLWNRRYIKWAPFVVKSDNNLDVLAKRYDYFVAGSDQIWNPYYDWGLDTFMFLKFAQPNQKVAYAASIGIDTLEKHHETKFREYLKDWKALSVRETSGENIVRKLSNNKVSTLIDPTLLLSAKEWRRLSRFCRVPYKKYVFVYLLGSNTPEYANYINDLANQNNWEIVDVMNDIRYAGASPSRFVALINHAEWVISDSFHAFVFANIFHKRFTFIDRQQYSFSINSRVTTLIEKLDINVPKLAKITEITNNDWKKIDKNLKIEQIKALNYLSKHLQ